LSPNLIESEIFGHERGSFTGAENQHQGFFERARGGTLFLDEVTEMPLALQVKLLRVLESGTFMRVGSTQVQQTDVRVIAATNRDVTQAVAAGALREDLLYRLNVFPIALPPLRDRLEDVPLLANSFLDELAQREKIVKRFSTAALDRLQHYHWPGNVRELRNAVQRAWVMASGTDIGDTWLPGLRPETSLAGPRVPAPAPASTDEQGSLSVPVGSRLADVERQLILATFAACGENKERTAASLGISLKTLYNRMKEYGRPS